MSMSEKEANRSQAHDNLCYYCAEPLEDGLCSAHCHESEDDEGRECECELE